MPSGGGPPVATSAGGRRPSSSAHQAARPTLEVSTLLDLIRLHLETVSFRVPPVELYLEVESACVSAEALNLLQRNPRRDTEAALSALARVRAEFGPDSVLSVRLKSGHLPEARSEWQPFESFTVASPRPVAMRPLVRRAHVRPRRLSPGNWEPSPGLGRLMDDRVNGGWWRREVRRDYRFVNTDRERPSGSTTTNKGGAGTLRAASSDLTCSAVPWTLRSPRLSRQRKP